MADANSVASKSTYMSQEEQNERRKRIREIMNDPNLTQQDIETVLNYMRENFSH